MIKDIFFILLDYLNSQGLLSDQLLESIRLWWIYFKEMKDQIFFEIYLCLTTYSVVAIATLISEKKALALYTFCYNFLASFLFFEADPFSRKADAHSTKRKLRKYYPYTLFRRYSSERAQKEIWIHDEHELKQAHLLHMFSNIFFYFLLFCFFMYIYLYLYRPSQRLYFFQKRQKYARFFEYNFISYEQKRILEPVFLAKEQGSRFWLFLMSFSVFRLVLSSYRVLTSWVKRIFTKFIRFLKGKKIISLEERLEVFEADFNKKYGVVLGEYEQTLFQNYYKGVRTTRNLLIAGLDNLYLERLFKRELPLKGEFIFWLYFFHKDFIWRNFTVKEIVENLYFDSYTFKGQVYFDEVEGKYKIYFPFGKGLMGKMGNSKRNYYEWRRIPVNWPLFHTHFFAKKGSFFYFFESKDPF